jgi:hypothetical protein
MAGLVKEQVGVVDQENEAVLRRQQQHAQDCQTADEPH